MKYLIIPSVLFVFIFLSPGSVPWAQSGNKADMVNGAGASFPFPVYAQWAYKYNQISGVKINYQSIGSGGGIAQIKAQTVDFGGTDAPLKIDELNAHGLLQFPMVMGGVVPIINLKQVDAGSIKLSPRVLVDIFLGKSLNEMV